MTHQRTLKFFKVLDSHGHFRFSNKQSLKANVHFLEKSKHYTYIIMFLEKIVV